MFKKSLSFASIAVLLLTGVVSCTKTTDPVDEPGTTVTIPAKTISGKLMHKKFDSLTLTWIMVPWDLGATTIKGGYTVSESIVTANVAADGSFTINLPATLSADEFVSPSLDLQITSDPTTLKKTIGPLILTVNYTDSGVALEGSVKCNTFTNGSFTTIKTIYAIYCFDRDGKIVGTNSFSGDSYNLNASKGWNFMTWDNTTSKYQYTLTSTIPTEVYFYL